MKGFLNILIITKVLLVIIISLSNFLIEYVLVILKILVTIERIFFIYSLIIDFSSKGLSKRITIKVSIIIVIVLI